MNNVEKNKNEYKRNLNKVSEKESSREEERRRRKVEERKRRGLSVRWGWEYDPNALVKEEGSFVGLVNQGGTCYMNSFLQQLYHIPAFADGLLSISTAGDRLKSDAAVFANTVARDGNGVVSDSSSSGVNGHVVGLESQVGEGEGVSLSPSHPAVTENEGAVDTILASGASDEKVLFQLQVMFGYLRLSEKRFFDTIGFCEAFPDYDGQPISLVEQKDINEFAGMLFDKLECNPLCSALLSRTVRGAMVFKTRSTETPYRSDREEPFYIITAEVKDKATLEDSLELYVADELFSGDNKLEDPDAGRKVDALRGCAFRTLPPTLIIHLKRFDFDLESMDRRKVNDHMSFPMELNMFPYTEEGLIAKEAKKAPAPAAEGADEFTFNMDEDEERYILFMYTCKCIHLYMFLEE